MKKLWRSVFWFGAFIAVVNLVFVIFKAEDISDIAFLIAGIFYLIPIYGYAYQVPIGSKLTSVIIFILNSPGFGLGAYMALTMAFTKPSLGQIFSSGIALGFCFLFIYPVYAYIFKSENLWIDNA